MIGEIRDEETAQYAIQAALTGHLVFSTLHTNDASTSIGRLADLGVERFLITSTLVGTMAQRLVRKICPHCTLERFLERDEASTLRLTVPEGKRVKVREGEGVPRVPRHRLPRALGDLRDPRRRRRRSRSW